MRRLKGYRVGDVGSRSLDRLSRQAEHQIEIEIAESGGMGGLGGGEGIAAVVNPPQPAQLIVIEALHPDGQAVDADFSKFRETAPLHRARIGFQGDFRIRAQRQAGAQARQQPL